MKNKKIGSFTHNGRKYEIDLLLDSRCNSRETYDVFDSKTGDRVTFFNIPEEESGEGYRFVELIGFAIEKLSTT